METRQSSNALQLVQGGMPAQEWLAQRAQAFISENAALVEATVEDILGDREIVEMFAKERRDEQARLEAERLENERREREEAERQARKAEEARQARVRQALAQAKPALRDKLGIPQLPRPLTAEEIKAKLVGPKVQLAEPKQEGMQDPRPEAVRKLEEKYSILLPALVFATWAYALAFRGWLCRAVKHFRFKADRYAGRPNADPDHLKALETRKEEFSKLFNTINDLVGAWGKDARFDVVPPEVFQELDRVLLGRDSKFARLMECPRPETAEERALRLAAEAKKNAQQVERELVKNEIVACLRTADSKLEPAVVKNIAAAVLESHGQHMEGFLILRYAAVDRMVQAENEQGEKVARLLARAAGLSDEQFDVAVAAFHEAEDIRLQEKAWQAQLAAEADRERRENPRFGECRKAPESKPKKGEGKGDAKKRGGRNRGNNRGQRGRE
ncbi:hypothetical protein EPN28_02435 [Patescibacteria group bacterium]|nr:MAG: hypothetical protein EPN28_02435 [Patescibacteria group bacterium]